MGRLWRDSGGSSEPLTRHTTRPFKARRRPLRTVQRSISRALGAARPGEPGQPDSLCGSHHQTHRQKAVSRWYRLRPHDGPLPFSLARVPTEVRRCGANGSLHSERACFCCKSRIKGRAGLVGGPAVGCGRKAQTGKRRGPGVPGQTCVATSHERRPANSWENARLSLLMAVYPSITICSKKRSLRRWIPIVHVQGKGTLT